MCGRYSISKKAREIGNHFRVAIPSGIEGGHFNAAPSQLLPVIAMDQPGSLQVFHWGLQTNWKSPAGNQTMVINARAESLYEKKMFSGLLSQNRCLVPADGFFEWEKAGKKKQPWRFVLKDEGLFAFAGLFDKITGLDGKDRFGFSIITTRSNELLEGIHNRMPVILDRQGGDAWLNETETERLADLFRPYPSGKMKSYKVTPKVNSASLNTSELIIPWQDPNLTLF